jgi:hypothetical protein
MRSVNFRAAVTIGCLFLALAFLAPKFIYGDEWNLTTRFTINHPFQVPGMVLQPDTRYVIRLLDSPANRNIVQIWNDDQTKMLTMFMAISALRPEPADKTVFSFFEVESGTPLPIKEWFYPGRINGLEFVYPKQQALDIAQHGGERVLATESADLHNLKTITVEAVNLGHGRQPIAQSSANITKSEETAVFEEKPGVSESAAVAEHVPVETSPEISVEQHQVDESAQVTRTPEIDQDAGNVLEEPSTEVQQPVVRDTHELPRTAGELPTIALFGLLCLGVGLGMRVLSQKS